MKHITVLYEDDRCIVLNKPAGLPVQGGEGVGASLDALLAEEWSPRPLLVHRLDKDTSGIILAAKNREAAALFSALFAGGKGTGKGAVEKRYLGVCAGHPRPESGIIEADLTIRGETKAALTRYTRISGTGEFSLLELELGTGRMHQIRRHLSHIGNPILGDDKYGNFALNKRLRKERGLKRLLLHASRLRIPASLCGFPLEVEAPLPDYFLAFIADF
ncbi:MAG: RluA family pseudouridine synthase [Spirochaetaceae bacterium]|nr:RluA family pseudouridine synthase [Spirochaetaceae bacterium]